MDNDSKNFLGPKGSDSNSGIVKSFFEWFEGFYDKGDSNSSYYKGNTSSEINYYYGY